MSRKISKVLGMMHNYLYIKRYNVRVGKGNTLNGRLFLFNGLGGEIKIGNNCLINSGKEFNPIGGDCRTILRTEKSGKIIIGNHVGISNSAIIAFSEIIIADDVMIGGNCMIFDSDFHSLDYFDRMNDRNVRSEPVEIREGAFIGCYSIILKGVTIGKHSVIGAGSVVTQSIPENEIWAGNPARFIRKIL